MNLYYWFLINHTFYFMLQVIDIDKQVNNQDESSAENRRIAARTQESRVTQRIPLSISCLHYNGFLYRRKQCECLMGIFPMRRVPRITPDRRDFAVDTLLTRILLVTSLSRALTLFLFSFHKIILHKFYTHLNKKNIALLNHNMCLFNIYVYYIFLISSIRLLVEDHLLVKSIAKQQVLP